MAIDGANTISRRRENLGGDAPTPARLPGGRSDEASTVEREFSAAVEFAWNRRAQPLLS